MFAITIRERSGQVYTFHFDKAEVLIGRVKGNDVILPKQNISKRHTLVRTQGKRFIVEDLGSTNGTYVNGHRIQTAVEIGADDKVYLGDFVMTFLDLSDNAAPPEVPVSDVDGGARAGDSESGFNVRSTQHMTNAPQPSGEIDVLADDDTFHAPMPALDDDLAAAMGSGGDDFGADLPPVEPLDMPAELGELGPIPSLAELDYADRLTGPVDALSQAATAAPQWEPPVGSSLASIPGLAGAIKPPARATPAVPLFQPATPSGLDAAAPEGTGEDALGANWQAATAATPASQTASATAQLLEDALPPAVPPAAPEPTAPPAATVAHGAPVSAAATASTVQDQPAGHFDQLAALFRNAVRDLRPNLPTDASQMSDSDWAEMESRVSDFVNQAVRKGEVAAGQDIEALRRELIYELAGLGPLEAMLDDPMVETIEVNGAEHIFVIRDGQREASTQRFSCPQALTLAVERLVRATGQTGRNGAQTEGTLPDGTSLFVVWPPVCPLGPAMVLRKPRVEAPSLQALVDRGTVSADAATVLMRLVQARRSVAIVGAAGLGKRTVLNALGQLIEPVSRLVVLEDGQRLRLTQEHVVRIDAVVMADSVVSPLHVAKRLRPDWLLVGDASGVSLDQLFGVTPDGLPPWLATFTALDAADLLERVQHALLLRHPGLSEEVARIRTLRGLDAVAVFVPDGRGGGSLREVYEVQGRGVGGEELVPLTGGAVQAR